MGISIKNEEVVAMIRELSDKTGESVTDAVRNAVKDRLETLGLTNEEVIEIKRKRVREIVERMQARPVLDDRDHAEMLYDEHGLPK